MVPKLDDARERQTWYRSQAQPMPNSPEAMSGRVEQLKAALVEQGRRVQSLLETAFTALFNRDMTLAKSVEALDTVVDQADVKIEQDAVELLTAATRESAHMPPQQLRGVLTIVKINNELERVADAGVDIAELVDPALVNSPPFPDTFRVMANSVVGILRDTTASFARSDPALAKVVLQSQHCVWAFKAAILRDAEERIAKGTMNVDAAFRLHEIASQCELIADHCTNIAEQVIYSTTGSIVRHTDAEWVEIPAQGQA